MASSHQLVRPALEPPDARLSATLTLIGVLVCGIAALVVTPSAATRAPAPVPSNRLAEAPPRVVKVIDGTERSDPCGERTWPYFDSRCPARANAAPQAALSPPVVSPAPAVPAAVIAPPLQPAKTPTNTPAKPVDGARAGARDRRQRATRGRRSASARRCGRAGPGPL